jgi:hypothetical protein
MLKSKYQPDMHTGSWDLSIKYSRIKATQVLEENPSLKPKLSEVLKKAYKLARIAAAQETNLPEKTFPKECPWTLKEILK